MVSNHLLRNISKYFLLVAFTSMVFFACDETEPPETLATPLQYFPLEIGKFRVYNVDSINYHETIPNDTSSWQVKEIIVDTFYDLTNNLNYTIERYRRQTAADEWIIANVWSVMFDNGQLVKNENNLRFIKLVEPVTTGTSWSGNVYLGGLDDLPVAEECNELTFYEDWEYNYANVRTMYDIDLFNFDNTLKVIQQGDSNLIWYDYAEEIYAENVGLIQQDFYHYYTQDLTCPTCPWEQRVQCGYSVKMRILDFN